MNYTRDVKRIEKIMGDARLAAWGPKLIPVEGKRKVKVNLGGGKRLDDNGNVVDGKLIDMVVEGGNVYILDPTTGQLESLDASAATPPNIKNTWFISTITSLLTDAIFRRSKPSEDEPTEQVESIDTDSEDTSAISGTSTPVERVEGRNATVKVGGKRRKAVKKAR